MPLSSLCRAATSLLLSLTIVPLRILRWPSDDSSTYTVSPFASVTDASTGGSTFTPMLLFHEAQLRGRGEGESSSAPLTVWWCRSGQASLDFLQLAQAVRAEIVNGAGVVCLGRVRSELAVPARPAIRPARPRARLHSRRRRRPGNCPGTASPASSRPHRSCRGRSRLISGRGCPVARWDTQ